MEREEMVSRRADFGLAWGLGGRRRTVIGGLGVREARAVRMERPSSPTPRTRMVEGSIMLFEA